MSARASSIRRPQPPLPRRPSPVKITPTPASPPPPADRRGIYREGVAGHLQHGQVVNGVAEDSVGVGQANPPESHCFALIGWDVDNVAGNEPLLHTNLGRQDALFGDAQIAQPFSDHPLVGGTDGPYVDLRLAQSRHQRDHLRKKARAHKLIKVFGGSRGNSRSRSPA